MKFIRCCLTVFVGMLLSMAFGCLPSMTSGIGQAKQLVTAKDYQGAIDIYQNVIETKSGTGQARQAQLFSDQAAQNAALQFNATSTNQVDQFYKNFLRHKHFIYNTKEVLNFYDSKTAE